MDRAADRHAEGLAIRRAVLGDGYVSSQVDGADEFSQPLQDLIIEYCWGTVWARDGLDRRSRSLVNLAMLTALGRPNELRLHTAGAINNGCTPVEIREVLLQAAVYCGIPAALDAFKIAQETIEGLDVG